MCFLRDLTIGAPRVRLGTKWPSCIYGSSFILLMVSALDLDRQPSKLGINWTHALCYTHEMEFLDIRVLDDFLAQTEQRLAASLTMTSTWSQSAPLLMTFLHSESSMAKSAERIEGEMIVSGLSLLPDF